MDGVDPSEIEAARAAAARVDGVGQVVVRGRWTGGSLVIEVEGSLPADLSLASADAIGRRVERAVLDAVPAARRVRWIARSCTVAT
jgi:divalent metal cation (Fe/Co/Zn/Cd) transporter